MKKWQKKVEILEESDKLMSKYFSGHDRIFYFIDHGTSSVTGEHLPVTVPFWSNYATDVKDDEMVPLNTLLNRMMR